MSPPIEEVWQEVPGFPNYHASTLGQIKSRRRSGSKGGILKQRINPKTGYVHLMLYRDGEPYTRTVHSLVAITFLGLRPVGKEVNHKDGDKQNNELGNLEYITRGENERHAYHLGLKHNRPPVHSGENHHNAKLTREMARQIRRRYCAGGWTQRQLGRHFRVSQQCIWNVLNGKTWTEGSNAALVAA